MNTVRKALADRHRVERTDLPHRYYNITYNWIQISILEETASAGNCYGRTAMCYQVIDEINTWRQWTGLTVLIDQNCLHMCVCVCVCVLHSLQGEAAGFSFEAGPDHKTRLYSTVCGVCNSWSIGSAIYQAWGDCCIYFDLARTTAIYWIDVVLTTQ
jgi:hypothetical protein